MTRSCTFSSRASRHRLATATRVVAAVFALAVLAGDGGPADAAETDPYYGWRFHLTDSSDELNAAAARIAAEELDAINLGPDGPSLRCERVARAITRRMVRAGSWHLFGPVGEWGFDYAPSNNEEYVEEYLPNGIYRYTTLWPLGAFARIGPSIEIDGVLVGNDKIGHFFSEGRRYWRAYQKALFAGATREEAERAAIRVGIRQEKSYFGWRTSGIVSYADLESNWQGFEYFRDLCEGDDAQLVYRDRKWVLTTPLDIRKYMNPCWDEAWNPNGLAQRHIRRVRKALSEMCPVFYRPDVQERWERYRLRGCDSHSQRWVMELVEAGELPDPSLVHIEEMCPLPDREPQPSSSTTTG